MSVLTDSQKKFYEDALTTTKQEISDLENRSRRSWRGSSRRSRICKPHRRQPVKCTTRRANGSASPTTSKRMRPRPDLFLFVVSPCSKPR